PVGRGRDGQVLRALQGKETDEGGRGRRRGAASLGGVRGHPRWPRGMSVSRARAKILGSRRVPMRGRVLSVAIVLAVLVACGSGDESVFQPTGDGEGGPPSTDSDGGNGTFVGGDGAALPEASDAACVAS